MLKFVLPSSLFRRTFSQRVRSAFWKFFYFFSHFFELFVRRRQKTGAEVTMKLASVSPAKTSHLRHQLTLQMSVVGGLEHPFAEYSWTGVYFFVSSGAPETRSLQITSSAGLSRSQKKQPKADAKEKYEKFFGLDSFFILRIMKIVLFEVTNEFFVDATVLAISFQKHL